MPLIPKDNNFEGELKCLSSGVNTVYKHSRGTPITSVRNTLAKPRKRSYVSEWRRRKDRRRDRVECGERFTAQGKVWDR
jgi:hypothetical protein